MDIPEYYRQFQNQPSKKEPENKKDELKVPAKPEAKNDSQKSSSPAKQKAPIDKTVPYTGNGFIINQLEDWQDNTIYTLTGPVTDSIQHNLVISSDKKPDFDDLIEYAEWHIKTLEKELKSCMILKKGSTKLDNGSEAYEVIYSWYPTDQIRIYQHQIFAKLDKSIFKMTASFTKKTRKTLGPVVERMMLSLNINAK